MGFNHNFPLSYDPAEIISRKRVENRSTPYVHTHRPSIDQYANQTEWVPNTLQEEEEQVFSTLGLHNLDVGWVMTQLHYLLF